MPAKLTIIDLTFSDNIQFESANWPASPHVRALTTRRIGGRSSGVFDSLNLADHVGDSPADVLHNRATLKRSLDLPSEPIWLTQVHGTNVVSLNDQCSVERQPNNGSPLIADGVMTNTHSRVCAIMTADCMPVFLCDRSGQEVALLHAGWRGLAAGIVESAIEKMQANAKDIFVWAGPSIGPKHFEVGKDVQRQLGGSSNCYTAHADIDKVFANLYLILAERLSRVGIADYSHSSSCTFRDNDQYFSYRRDGECGRMASLIWIDK